MVVSTIVKAAAVHISPVLSSRHGTISKVVTKIGELVKHGVQFATFPETVIPYYPYFSFIQAPIQNIAGPEQRKLLDQAVTVPFLQPMSLRQPPSRRASWFPSA